LFARTAASADDAKRRLRSALRRVVETWRGVRFTPQQNLLLTDIPDGGSSGWWTDPGRHTASPVTALSVVATLVTGAPGTPHLRLGGRRAERVLPT